MKWDAEALTCKARPAPGGGASRPPATACRLGCVSAKGEQSQLRASILPATTGHDASTDSTQQVAAPLFQFILATTVHAGRCFISASVLLNCGGLQVCAKLGSVGSGPDVSYTNLFCQETLTLVHYLTCPS